MITLFSIFILIFCTSAWSEDTKIVSRIELNSESPLKVESNAAITKISIPDSVRKLVSNRWKNYRLIEKQDLKGITEYWSTNHTVSDTPIPFAAQADIDGDGTFDVVLPIRHIERECEWKAIAVHVDKNGYKLYELDNSDRYGGPCAENKPWYGFEIEAYSGGVAIHYVSSSCAVAYFDWDKNRNQYIERIVES